MTKALINIDISSKQELDEIIRQYENGGRALMLIDDYQDILRNAYKHGHDQYLSEIKKLIEANENFGGKKICTIDDETLSTVASACLEYFRTKYYETKAECAVQDSY